MNAPISALAGHPAPASLLVNIPRLLAAYVDLRPNPAVPAQRIAFGASGHRGSSLERSFNEGHVQVICQAICDVRSGRGVSGPMYVGIDTHALSLPAFESALEVLAANGVETRIAPRGEFTPAPAVSHAILAYNRGRTFGLADGIVITPSHNPPDNGGLKYNTPGGGPANAAVAKLIQDQANALLEAGMKGVRRIPFAQARRLTTTGEYDFLDTYVTDLDTIIDFESIRSAGIRMAVDPLGGAGVQYWAEIAERYKLDLTIISDVLDPTFGFMTVDRDGRIRMDPSSPWAMQRLIAMKDRYDVAFACDTDHDRHGIVTRNAGLLPSNHYLVAAIDYLFRHRPQWRSDIAIGKTVVSTAMIDRLAASLDRGLYEVPVGFKWFAEGLLKGELGFAGEESAGASFCRIDGMVWTTDKDGMAPALLAAEMTARTGSDPGERYAALAHDLGQPVADRLEVPATTSRKQRLAAMSAMDLRMTRLGGERIESVIDHAPGNDAAIGGIKVTAASGWFAARSSGTEDVYRIYAESFRGEDHLRTILDEAQTVVEAALTGA